VNIHRENPNLPQLAEAAKKLSPLLDQIVFLGGCATGLLLTDPAAAPVRATFDVDAIIEVASYTEFGAVEQQLRKLGFHQPIPEGAPVCRWVSGNLILDLMPIDPSILGFSNRWYRAALAHSARIEIDEHDIRLVSAPYFLATKLEAFHGRGEDDLRISRDLEDIIAVIDGRPELAEEIRQSELELRQYLSHEFASLLTSRDFRDALPGFLLSDMASQQRIGLVVDRIRQIMDASS
jgi:predicted nucleotidyltransferase